MRSSTEISVEGEGGRDVPAQIETLDRWSDGTVRWALLDLRADASSGRVVDYAVRIGLNGSEPARPGLAVNAGPHRVRVTTGTATFEFGPGDPFPLGAGDPKAVSRGVDFASSGFQMTRNGHAVLFTIDTVRVRSAGPLRAELEIAGKAADQPSTWPIEVEARVELFAGACAMRVDLTIRNRRRARHAGGRWMLGDPGSLLFTSAVVLVRLTVPPGELRCAPEPGAPVAAFDLPFEIYQESSGGDQWNAPVHRNRDGRVPLRFRGYRLRAGTREVTGLRANPVVTVESADGPISVALPEFWQNFPRAIGVDEDALTIGLAPAQSGDLHELQGGEQKTHRFLLAFGADTISSPPLAWCHDPIRLRSRPEWYCRSGVVPHLYPPMPSEQAYESLVAGAHDQATGFLAKRELADEYGWRNFGDLPADHESALLPSHERFVSHYNNQYDAIAAFAAHFLRSSDIRWWRLMDELARHVRDIDIYHTEEDKAAYNHGLFWHTQHYLDAGTSTHRTYPAGSGGGGPASEHNYNTGLMLHYFLTGERASRTAAVGLGEWVLAMDDGRQSPFHWLAPGSTGLASATGSMSYHGPGRGAANSIVACLVAHRLTHEARFLLKAEELIRRCIHPEDDIEARDLFDVERRWYYTVFLQALGVYLHAKIERAERDSMYAYARDSLLRYARWMVRHERPYLEHPERLEFPTETWVAQDLRKGSALVTAALYAPEHERPLFLAGARRFYDYAIETLSSMPQRQYTRPLVLVLGNGVQFAPLHHEVPCEEGDFSSVPYPPPVRFEAQRIRAVKRAWRIGAVGLLGLGVAAAGWLIAG